MTNAAGPSCILAAQSNDLLAQEEFPPTLADVSLAKCRSIPKWKIAQPTKKCTSHDRWVNTSSAPLTYSFKQTST
jgi:hypothetical protein